MEADAIRAGWRDRLYGGWWLYPAIFVFMAVVYPALLWGTSDHQSSHIGSLIVSGIVFAAIMTVVFAVQNRRSRSVLRSHSIQERAEIARALRSGEPPADRALDQDVTAIVDRQRSQLTSTARFSPWLFGAFVLLSIGLAVTEQHAYWLAYAAFFVAAGGLSWWGPRRTLVRLERLDSALADRHQG